MTLLNEQDISPTILSAAKAAGVDSNAAGVFCECNAKRYYIKRCYNGKFYVKVSRKRNRNPI